jgi:thiol-disulfide isomerase/thioredoxin
MPVQAYDLWRHNCNNFTNDFATFLVGKGIPNHITDMPQTVLNSPLGRLLQPAIDDAIKNSQNHQRTGGLLGIEDDAAIRARNLNSRQRAEAVRIPASLQELNDLLASARESCAVVFFTSETCAPCKILYPVYDELAAELSHKCVFIKIDTGKVLAAGQAFSITATPTFVTFLGGEEERRWSGADANALRGNVKLLSVMAWPAHPHESLKLPKLRGASMKPIVYKRIPPLDKLLAKIGDGGRLPAVQGVKYFIATSEAEGAAASTLPDLDAFSHFLRNSITTVPLENMFAVLDLVRIAIADPRFSGYYAQEKDHKTIAPLLEYANNAEGAPYALRLVALQLTCNLFSSSLYIHHILNCLDLRTPIIQLTASSVLDDKHPNVRIAAASVALNIATANSLIRREDHQEALPEDDQVELAASLLEAIRTEEESHEALNGFLLAIGQLIYCAKKDGGVVDLLKSLDAQETILAKKKSFPDEALITEIGKELLGTL